MSDSFCVQPWISLGVRTYGSLCVCPHMDYQIRTANISELSPQDFRSSKDVEVIKQDMLAGKTVAACHGCKFKEAINEKHHDLKTEILISQDLAPKELKSLRLDLGNHCNLMCPTCGIHGSSNWEKVVRALLPEQFSDLRFDWPKDLAWSEDPYSLFSEVSDLTFSGGEPFLIDGCTEILKKLVSMKRAPEISLSYATNSTVNPESLVDLWSNFKEVNLNLSIYATGDRYEFLRTPAKWNEVEKNIHSFMQLPANMNVRILCHLSIMNFFHLKEFINWFRDLKKRYPEKNAVLQINPISNPSYLSLSSFSDDMKVKCKEWLIENKNAYPELDVTILSEMLSIESKVESETQKRKVFFKTFLKHAHFDLPKIFPELKSIF